MLNKCGTNKNNVNDNTQSISLLLILSSGLRTAGATAAEYTTWTNGDAVTVTDWMENQPSSAAEECVVMDADNDFKWNDVLCTAPAAYVCKTEPVCPTGKTDVHSASVMCDRLVCL